MKINSDSYAGVQRSRPGLRLQGRDRPGIEDFDHAILLNPARSVAFNNRGLAYRSKGETYSAITNYEQAIPLNPEFALAYYNRGNAYSTRDYDRADLGLQPGDQDQSELCAGILRSRRRLL